MTASATISTKSDRRASDELGLWEPKRALTLDAARAHTQRIRVIRYVLMVISAVLVATLLWQFMSNYKTFIFKDGMTAQLTENQDDSAGDTSFGFAGDGPINVKADKGIYQGDKTDLRGNVRVVQDGAVITSDRMNIFRLQESGGSDTGSVKLGAVSKIIATGNFHYKSAENDIRGGKGVYQRDKNIMTVTGDVTVLQPGGNRVQAQQLTYNTKTETIRFSGQCLGRGCKGNGRTRIVIPGSDN